MRIPVLLSLIMLLLCGLLNPALSLESPKRVTLPNGISLIVQETYSSPTVSLNIFIRCGSMHEKPEVNGIAHFYEHMFFRGTPRRTGLEFKRQIEALGGTTNAATSRDFTHFYINLPREYVNEGLDLLADAYLNAECSQESVDAERDVVLEEYRIGKSQPARIMSDKIYSLVFRTHPYGRTIIGTEDNLHSIGRKELLDWKHTFYVPDRTSLVIVGDVNRDEVVARCRQLFGDYQAPRTGPDQFAVDTPPTDVVSTTEASGISKSFVVLGYLGPSVKDKPDVYQIDMLSFLIGYGKQSLLARALGEKNADDARIDFLTQAFPGVIIVTAVAEPGHENAVKEKVTAVLEQVQRGEFTDKDIARARTLLRNTYRFGAETNAGKADNLGFYETIDRVDFAINYLKEVDKVSKADLMAAARKYFGRNHYEVVFKATPKKKREDG